MGQKTVALEEAIVGKIERRRKEEVSEERDFRED